MELLRLITAGSVDDGKSTLIGRLLYDTKALLQDQLSSLERSSRKKGLSYLDFSLITDGLKDEIMQGITIDVAYRYFTSGQRKYIIADTPGHVQYTRNFVTAASTANMGILLIDARKGVTEQTRRHALIASMMGVKHLIFCINKMDLVQYDRDVFYAIQEEIEKFSAKLGVYDVKYIPVSALHGENIAQHSDNMAWYRGWSLLETIEQTHISSDRNLIDGRFPVQTVIRINKPEYPDHRAYAGRIASGIFRKGDEVTVLPSAINTKIKSILGTKGEVDEAEATSSVSLVLEDDIDVGRGDMIVRKNNHPIQSGEIDAMLCILSNTVFEKGTTFILRTQTQELKAQVIEKVYRMDVHTFSKDEENRGWEENDIVRVRMKLSKPLIHDVYKTNRGTGSFILIDEQNNTVAAGMCLHHTLTSQ